MIKLNRKYADQNLYMFECSSFFCIGGLIFYTSVYSHTRVYVTNYDLQYSEIVFYSLPNHIKNDENFILLKVEKSTEISESEEKNSKTITERLLECEYILTLKTNPHIKKNSTIITLNCGISFIMESHYSSQQQKEQIFSPPKEKYCFSFLDSKLKRCFRTPLNLIDIPIQKKIFNNYLFIIFFLKESVPIIDIISLIIIIIVYDYSVDVYNYIDHPLLDNI
jgi:hypothetical protein